MSSKLLAGVLGAAFLSVPLLAAEIQTHQKPAGYDSDMQRAIAWEHYKAAAAARQARIEAKHPTVFYNNADRMENNANRNAPLPPDVLKALNPPIGH